MIWSRLRSRVREHVRRHPGQSLVEFTILLPVLLIMISGLIEFGFLLNYYLDLIDAAREAARWGAGDDPIHDDTSGNFLDPNEGYYARVGSVAESSIDTGSGGQITLDPSADDVVMSAFSITGGSVDERYPTIFGEDGHCRYGYNPVTSATCNHNSEITSAEVNALLDPSAPNTGVVVVEIWYDYNMILGLPWITAFVPNPVTLYAYSIMPNSAVEPTPTPP
jgi:Flp pilus assembly protein TadG